MCPETTLTKDVIWYIDGKKYVIQNVPYSKLQAEEEEYFDMDVSVRLTILRDLMYMNDIPLIIDYKLVEGFEI
ncbi:hypothetical protein MUB24_21400 [Lederbergia sp. NSJ-179]|uniref:hypothetical protein n=1 Tax=Lederbergia sp. NSJ-179 TaxID=2931402 RepID=UPI001FD277CD|nr:hypothetical protein [Lederbergia sp. NSJ-179]MCJ7843384.1 hypothetical protein [Lederbergia sp. NSJ-179]